MKINGIEVTYVMFMAKNSETKTFLRRTNATHKLVKVSELEPVEDGNYETARVWLGEVQVMDAVELIHFVMMGRVGLSNPSIFSGWGGWNYKKPINRKFGEYPCARRTRERLPLFDCVSNESWWRNEDDTCEGHALVYIPSRFNRYIRLVQKKGYKYERIKPDTVRVTKKGAEEESRHLVITLEYICIHSKGKVMRRDFPLTIGEGCGYTFRYTEVSASEAKKYNLPKAGDGKYYNLGVD